jgi:large subunit ribosomal protein L33
MPQPNLIKLACTKCKHINYISRQNKKDANKLALNKRCKWCGAVTVHKVRKK